MTINPDQPHYKTLGAYAGAGPVPDTHPEELRAAHERIDELKSCLAELVGIYWAMATTFIPRRPASFALKLPWRKGFCDG